MFSDIHAWASSSNTAIKAHLSNQDVLSFVPSPFDSTRLLSSLLRNTGAIGMIRSYKIHLERLILNEARAVSTSQPWLRILLVS